MQVHLVDGTFELFRHFYSKYTRPTQRPDGLEVGAARAVVKSLLSLLREPEVTHIGVAFDTVIESFRNDLFSGYKTGTGIDPALYAQFPVVEEACRRAGIVVWSMIAFEADDALATAAARWADAPGVDRVVLCSPDKDLCQCVRGQRVVTFDRIRRKVIDEDGVVERIGVRPSLVPDFLALVGDTADGIPGLPKWGEKSAAAVLGGYGGIDAIPDDGAAWTVPVRGSAALAESLKTHRAEAALYRTLATLRTDVPLAETLEDLRWRGVADREWLARELDLDLG